MSLSLLVYLGIGAVLGGALGYFGNCSSGACPLTANWRRGAVVGALISLAAFVASGTANSTAMSQSTANVKRIQAGDFNAEVLQSPSPVLVDFYATWCAPCRQLSPRIEAIAAEFSGKVKFVKIDFDESQLLAEHLGVSGLPTLLIFENGKVADGLIGLQTEAALRARLQAVTRQSP